MNGIYDFKRTISQIISSGGREALLDRESLNEMVQYISKSVQTRNMADAFSRAGVFKNFIDARDDLSEKHAYKASLTVLTENFLLAEDTADLYLQALAKILWGKTVYVPSAATVTKARPAKRKRIDRKKINTALICAACILLTIFGIHVFGKLSPEDLKRNSNGYLIIHNAKELAAMNTALDEKYILLADIDLSNVSWTPVGTEENPFTGELYAAGRQIKGLTIDEKTESGANYGLFGVAKNATIRNLRIDVDEKVKAESDGQDPLFLYMGAIAGTLDSSTVTNCIIEGSINGSTGNNIFCRTGLVCGQAVGSVITNCDISGNSKAEADNTLNSMAGLAAGWLQESTVSDCIVQGTVSANGELMTGSSGLIGYAGGVAGSGASSSIESCIIDKNTYITSIMYGDAVSPIISSSDCYVCSNTYVINEEASESSSDNQKTFDTFSGTICRELQWDENIWKYTDRSHPLLKAFYGD